jgi:tRNA A37 N6-isopentenylltransferase MiaA
MHAQLAQVDAITAARLKPNDAQRIQRALEVYRITGKPLSSFQTAYRDTAPSAINSIAPQAINTPAIGQKDHYFSENNSNPLFISLEPQDRAWLHARIALRFDAMLEGGFEQEVRALRARADLSIDTASMRCVGYRQMWEALDTLNRWRDGRKNPARPARQRHCRHAPTVQAAIDMAALYAPTPSDCLRCTRCACTSIASSGYLGAN